MDSLPWICGYSTKGSPMTFKRKVKVKFAPPCPTLCNPMGYSPWNSPGQNTGVGNLYLFPGDPLNPGIKPRTPSFIAGGFFTT